MNKDLKEYNMRPSEKLTFYEKKLSNHKTLEETLLFDLCHKINLHTKPAHSTAGLQSLYLYMRLVGFFQSDLDKRDVRTEDLQSCAA